MSPAVREKITTEVIPVGPEQIAVRRTAGSGEPVVLLHGIMDSGRSFDLLAQELPRPTLAFDLPGFGRSSLLNSTDINYWADVYLQALAAAEIDFFTVVGHSLGGALGAAMAQQAPQQVAALLLVAPAGFSKIALSRALTRPGVETVLRATAPWAMGFDPLINILYHQLFSHHQSINPELKVRLKQDRRAMIPGVRQGMRLLADLYFEQQDYPGAVSALWGDHDHLIPAPAAAQRLQQLLPQANVTILPQTGHHPQAERSEQFRQWLMENY